MVGDNVEIIVRDYEEKDFDAVNELIKESFSYEKGAVQGDMYHEVVGCIDNKVVGYLLMIKMYNPIAQFTYYLLDHVCVSSQYRGMHVGEAMVEYAEKLARESSAKYIQLSCSRFRIAAHKLYEKCGFYMRESDMYRKEIV